MGERAAEGNIIKEDILKEHTESLAEGEGDTGDKELGENKAKNLVETDGATNDQTLNEDQEMLIGMMRFLDKYEEDSGRAAKGTLRKEDLLRKQIEKEAKGNRTDEDFEKDQIEMWTGMKRFIDKLEMDEGAASGSLLRMTNLAKEQINRFLQSARETVDPTVHNTTGKADDWKELEDICKGQIDLVNAVRELLDPSMEKNIKGIFAGGMDQMTDIFQELLDTLAALKEAEHPTQEDNEGLLPDVKGKLQDLMTTLKKLNPLIQMGMACMEEIRGPLTEVQVNVDDWKRNITEAMASWMSDLDGLLADESAKKKFH